MVVSSALIRYKMSLRSKRLRGIEKQSRQNIENPVSRSFFASQPHVNACYAGS